MSTSAPTTPPRREVRELPAIQKLVADGLQRGYLTPEEMARALPSELGADHLEEVRAFIGESRHPRGRGPAARAAPLGAREGDRRRAHQRSGARLPARDGPGVAAHARGRGRDRDADRVRPARAAARRARHPVRRARGARGGRGAAQEQGRAQERGGRPRRSSSRSTRPEERRRDFFATIAKVKKLEADAAKKHASIQNSRTSEDTRKRLRAEISELYDRVVELLRETRYASSRIFEAQMRLEAAHTELRRLGRARAQADPAVRRRSRRASASSRCSRRAAAGWPRRRSTACAATRSTCQR